MAISVALDRILEQFLGRGKGKRVQIATYLEAVADDAEMLCKVWLEALEKIGKTECSSSNGAIELAHKAPLDLDLALGSLRRQCNLHERKKNFGRKFDIGQGAIHSRLDLQYRGVSVVFDGEVSSHFQASFMQHLAAILLHRRASREMLNSLLPLSDSVVFVDPVNRSERIINLEDAVAALHREAAAVRVLAREFRARA